MGSERIKLMQGVISRLFCCKAIHLKTAQATADSRQTNVEVFSLIGHPVAFRCYAWLSDTNSKGEYFIGVLEVAPVKSPESALQMARTTVGNPNVKRWFVLASAHFPR
jgi:hypothetical protein